MRNASLSCFAIIVLSFLAARAEGQIDSNVIVKLYCGTISDSCQMILIEPPLPGAADTVIASLTVEFDSTYRIADMDHSQIGSKIGKPNPPFEIDTINREIVNLKVYNIEALSNVSGGDGLIISFSPIPYSLQNNQITVSGIYQCNYYFNSICQYPFSQQTCQDTGTTTDSLFLQIKQSSLDVFNSNLPSKIRFITTNGIQLFEFTATSETRIIEIWNPIGAVVLRTAIGAGETSHEILLPPGLYFARLGDQLAKFVVPPR